MNLVNPIDPKVRPVVQLRGPVNWGTSAGRSDQRRSIFNPTPCYRSWPREHSSDLPNSAEGFTPMGFYVRTSLRAGPFRFGLSRSGLGVSVGVPGFRVGAGPRGNYVRLGTAGVHYLATTARRPGGRSIGAGPWVPQLPVEMSPTVLQPLDGASAEQLVAAHPTDLTVQLQQAAHRSRLWPWLAVAVGVVSLATMPFGLLVLVLGVPAVIWARLRDQSRRSVVVFYDVNDASAVAFDALCSAVAELGRAHGVWSVDAEGALSNPYQQKTHAGAQSLLSRSRAAISMSGPSVLVTNIAVPTIALAGRSLHFLPDRILVRRGNTIADVDYKTLQVDSSHTRFVETGVVPRDAEQIGTTWQKVNKDGGPDRRFRDNRQLPVMHYGRLTLGNANGLTAVVDASRPDLVRTLARVIAAMG
jgi:DNA polymerase-3 subunit epsilon